MKLPVDTIVQSEGNGFDAKLWYFSHYDPEGNLFHVFPRQLSSMMAEDDATEVFSSIKVVVNKPDIHKGDGCPVSHDIYVKIIHRNGTQEKGFAHKFKGWSWGKRTSAEDIIGFQILGDSITRPDGFHEAIEVIERLEDSPHSGNDVSPCSEQSQEHFIDTFQRADKYDAEMMDTAFIWKRKSPCKRLKVGAALSLEGRSIMTGYNGTVEGADNCCEYKTYYQGQMNGSDNYDTDQEYRENINKKYPYEDELGRYFLTTKMGVVHAEKNIILFCAKKGIATQGATLYTTTSPCKTCAADIAQAGIVRVVYSDIYRDAEGIAELKRYGIKVDRFIRKEGFTDV